MYKILTLNYLLNGKVYNDNQVYSFDNENLATTINITVPDDYEDFSFVMDCQNGTVTKQYSLGSGETTYSIEIDDSLTLTGTLELQLWATILSGGETIKVQWQKFNVTIDDALNISTITAEDNPDIIATHTAQLSYLMGIITDTGDGTLFLSDDGTYKSTGAITNYEDLTNKPQINSVELVGNKTSADLGLQPAGSYEPANSNIQTHIADSTIHLTSTEKSNVGNLVENGDGLSYLANDGTYKNTKVNRAGDTMTGDLNFTASGVNDADYLDLNIGATPTLKEGRLHWNALENCLQADTPSGATTISQNLGQTSWIRVRNTSGATIPAGKAVYTTGGLGNVTTIALAKADSLATSLTFIGLTATSLTNNQNGFVVNVGYVENLNTSGWTAGQLLYLSATNAGELTTTRPEAPNIHVIVGAVRISNPSNGVIAIKGDVFSPYRALSDVHIPTGFPNNNDIMKYNLSALRWEQYSSDALKVYSGFVNRTDSTISVNASGVVTLAPAVTSFTTYINGIKRTISSTQTVTVTDDQTITYIYLDSNAVLQKSTSAFDFTSIANIPVALCFKDSTTYALTDERHGYERNRAWHNWAHNNIGAVYKSGFTGTFTDTTLSVTQGIIYDEDILADSGGTKTTTSLWYRNATNGMRLIRGSTYAKYVSGGVLQYDNGSGTLQNVDINSFVTNWVYATNDPNEPIYTVIGQNNSGNINLARNTPAPTINLSTAEWKLIYRVIYQRTNAVASGVYVEAADFRTVQTGIPTTAVITDHNSLINRDAASSHPASAISYDSTTVQTELDNRENFTYTLDILTGDWSANSFAQQITGLTDYDIVLIQAPDSYYTSWGLSYTQSGDTITFTVTTTPTETLSLGIAVTKASNGGAL